MSNRRNAVVSAVCLPVLLTLSPPSFAEAPMNVDDAGTMDKSGMKIEGAWHKDDQTRGPELVFGFSPMENIEIGLGVARDRDHGADPAAHLDGAGIGLKWVPIQNETGWSFGASLDLGWTRVKDYVTPDRYTEREVGLNGLATWRAEAGHTVHVNLGMTRAKAQGQSDTVASWGVGYEHPLADSLRLTAEIFGEEHASADKAIGLRYEAFDGFKISAAVGRGNGRNFGQVGFAWEF